MTRRNTVRIYEDPTIAHVAKIEAVRVWTEIEDTCIAQNSFYLAREKVLAANIPKIAKAYGSEVARRVEVAIMSRAPHTMDKRVQKEWEERVRVFAVRKWGRLRKRDAISIALTGYVWSLPPHKPGDTVIVI
jgi:hypothetical protein